MTGLLITETTEWPATVTLIDTDDVVIGGAEGIANAQAIALTSRVNWLRARMDAVITEAGLSADDLNLALFHTALKQVIGTYDIPFKAGENPDGTYADLAVQRYGGLVLPRPLVIKGEQFRCGTAPVGADLVVDIRVNSVSIYSTLPLIAASATTGTAGILTTPAGVAAAAGDLVEFFVTQVGSTTAGQYVLFSILGHLG